MHPPMRVPRASANKCGCACFGFVNTSATWCTDSGPNRSLDTPVLRTLPNACRSAVRGYVSTSFGPHRKWTPPATSKDIALEWALRLSEVDAAGTTTSVAGSDDVCALCLELLDSRGPGFATRLPHCDHYFHLACISAMVLPGGEGSGLACAICRSGFQWRELRPRERAQVVARFGLWKVRIAVWLKQHLASSQVRPSLVYDGMGNTPS